jgi:hypothetical protein
MALIPARILPVLAAVGLCAAEFTGGLQLGPALPLGDLGPLTGRQLGAGAVLFGLYEFDEGQCYRLRLDAATASGRARSQPSAARVTAVTASLGVDELFYLEGRRDRGIYLGIGPNLTRNRLTLAGAEYVKFTPGLAVSVGLQLNRHWQLEATARLSRFKGSLADGAINASMIPLLLVIGYAL